jgi:hypothetical protein
MGKYDPLTAYLKQSTTSEVPMRFEEVARIIGAKLPLSAYIHRPWWANETTGHVHAKSWLDAGYETAQVDMDNKKLVFKRLPGALSGMAEESHEFIPAQNASENRQNRHPALGAMKGTFTIEPGYDLTSPIYTDEEWAEIEKEMSEDWDQIEQGMSGGNK